MKTTAELLYPLAQKIINRCINENPQRAIPLLVELEEFAVTKFSKYELELLRGRWEILKNLKEIYK